MAKNRGDAVMKPLIQVELASVNYCIRNGASSSLKETAIRALKREKLDLEVKALHEVSFSVMPGEVLAVVGRNGAGKSTLLKLLARVLPPTQGRVLVNGSVAPMIELGAGFSFELTGRENCILYGTLLGRSSKEMRVRADEISEWAEIQEAFDRPLRTYSSGMVSRLAFAVATDMRSDVILIDEVLSVGDSNFTKKSTERLNSLFHSGSAVILVSHSSQTVRDLATKALWLDHGQVMEYGEVERVLHAYEHA